MKLGLFGGALGAGFGFVLAWAGLADPQVIRAMLLLEDFYVFGVMGSAMAIAALGLRVLRAFKVRSPRDGQPLTWPTARPKPSQLLGAALFGTGWALAGACPGPVAVQLGQGQPAALLTLGGLLAGVALAHLTAPSAVAESTSMAVDAPT